MITGSHGRYTASSYPVHRVSWNTNTGKYEAPLVSATASGFYCPEKHFSAKCRTPDSVFDGASI